jgi:D-methionine transport system substrate-binding protein
LTFKIIARTPPFFLIVIASLTASTVLACGSSQKTATNSGAAPSSTTVAATGTKETIKVGVTPVPAGDILKFVKDNLAPKPG